MFKPVSRKTSSILGTGNKLKKHVPTSSYPEIWFSNTQTNVQKGQPFIASRFVTCLIGNWPAENDQLREHFFWFCKSAPRHEMMDGRLLLQSFAGFVLDTDIETKSTSISWRSFPLIFPRMNPQTKTSTPQQQLM